MRTRRGQEETRQGCPLFPMVARQGRLTSSPAPSEGGRPGRRKAAKGPLASASFLGLGRPSWQCPWELSPGPASHTQASQWASGLPQMPGQLGTSRGAEAQALIALEACPDLQADLRVLKGRVERTGSQGHLRGGTPPVTIHAPRPCPPLYYTSQQPHPSATLPEATASTCSPLPCPLG